MNEQGAIVCALMWVFGRNWKTTLLGYIQMIVKFVPAIALIPSNVIPASLRDHWPTILCWSLFLSGIASVINGTVSKDK